MQAFDARWQPEAKLISVAGVVSAPMGATVDPQLLNDPPSDRFRTADDPADRTFPAHYRVYILDAVNRGAWNHGHLHGIAISTETNEVVFFAESW